MFQIFSYVYGLRIQVCPCLVVQLKVVELLFCGILRMINHIDFTCGRLNSSKYQHLCIISLSIAVGTFVSLRDIFCKYFKFPTMQDYFYKDCVVTNPSKASFSLHPFIFIHKTFSSLSNYFSFTTPYCQKF